MSINLSVPGVIIREDRLSALTEFSGTVGALAEGARGCGLQNGKRCMTQNNNCMSGCAQGYLSAITDAAIVNHAPLGCAADSMGANNSRKWGEFAQGIRHRDVAIFNTNMNDQDTVFGALEKLRSTVRATYTLKNPAAIFVTTSCVSAIIGEDVESAARELREELGIPVVPVLCEGFRTKIWATGFDAAFHAILTGIVLPARKKTNIVNVVNFRASLKKNIPDLFARLGVKPLFIAGYCTIEELSHLSEAAATVSVCGTLGTYIGNGLEQGFGVPYVKALQPHGIEGYESWVRELGRVLGKEAEAEAWLSETREAALPEIGRLKEKLRGTRAVVGMGPSFAFNFARALGELGVEVLSVSAWHLDQRYDHGAVPESIRCLAKSSPDMPVRVNGHQYYETASMLEALKPDVYLYRHPSNAAVAMKLGISAVSIIDEYTAFGYDGLIDFGNLLLDTLANRNFERKLAEKMRLPFLAREAVV